MRLTDRILELFPLLGEVEDWRSDETEAGEPIVLIEMNASFTGPRQRRRAALRADPEHQADRRIQD
jgi:hypothetical protein